MLHGWLIHCRLVVRQAQWVVISRSPLMHGIGAVTVVDSSRVTVPKSHEHNE